MKNTDKEEYSILGNFDECTEKLNLEIPDYSDPKTLEEDYALAKKTFEEYSRNEVICGIFGIYFKDGSHIAYADIKKLLAMPTVRYAIDNYPDVNFLIT